MPPIFIVLVVIAVVLAAIGIAVWENQRFRDRRREELAGWARANGLKFLPENDYSIGFRYHPFKCLQQGDNRYGCNIMVGTSGQRVMCGFDYHCETHAANSNDLRPPRHHHFSAVVVDAGLPLKPLFIRPGGLLDKVMEFIGIDGIDFESAEFSQSFCVKSPDRRWAYDVLHQKTLELMLDYPRFHIEMQGTQVVAYSGQAEFSAGEFQSALKLVTGILDYLPDSLVRELKGIDSGGVLS
jgi:hypothetical protein